MNRNTLDINKTDIENNENDVALQGISFNFEENTSRILRKHITNKLFISKTSFNNENEVFSGFIIYKILS